MLAKGARYLTRAQSLVGFLAGCTLAMSLSCGGQPARWLAELPQISRTDARRTEVALLRVHARALAQDQAPALLREDSSGRGLRVDARIAPPKDALTLTAANGALGPTQPDGSLLLPLARESERAAARRFFQQQLTVAEQRVEIAAANLMALPGSRRLVLGNPSNQPERDFRWTFSVATGHPLDVAPADPAALFRVWTVGGHARYAALGRFYLTADRHLVTASGLFALAPPRKAVPKGASHLTITPQGHVRAKRSLGRVVELGRLEVIRFAPGAQPATEARGRELVYAAPAGEGAVQPVDLDTEPLRIGVYLDDRSEPALEIAALKRGELLRETSRLALRAIERYDDPAARTLMVFGRLPWTMGFLQHVKQPHERFKNGVILDVSNRAQSLRNLRECLAGLLLCMKIHRANVENAATIQPVPYRRKRVSIGKNGALKIEEDPAPLRKVRAPQHEAANANGFVLYPNVIVEVDHSEWTAAVREHNIMRQAIMRLSTAYVIPALPLPPPLAGKGGSESFEGRPSE